MTTNVEATSIPNDSPWRWSLQDVFVAFAILSAFLAILVFMGPNNPFYWACAFFSAVLTITFWCNLPNSRYLGCWVAIIIVAFFQCNPLAYFSCVMAVNCFLHILLISFSKSCPQSLSPIRTLVISSVFALISFVVGVGLGLPSYFGFVEAQKQFQPQDFRHRLSYEADLESEPLVENGIRDTDYLPSKAEFEFDAAKDSTVGRFLGRERALESIHNGQIEIFVKSQGFGIGRFLNPTIEQAREPSNQDIPFDGQGVVPYYRRWQDHLPFSETATSESHLHLLTTIDFVHPATLGLVTEPGIVIGNQSHALHLPIQETAGKFLGNQNLRLKSLELISLRRFKTPRAYVLGQLPRMDKLSGDDVSTRELNQFEANAIKTLENHTGTEGSDIVEKKTAEGMVMVGAVRAFNACLECHNAKRNELLGAFTYRFDDNGTEGHTFTEQLQDQ